MIKYVAPENAHVRSGGVGKRGKLTLNAGRAPVIGAQGECGADQPINLSTTNPCKTDPRCGNPKRQAQPLDEPSCEDGCIRARIHEKPLPTVGSGNVGGEAFENRAQHAIRAEEPLTNDAHRLS